MSTVVCGIDDDRDARPLAVARSLARQLGDRLVVVQATDGDPAAVLPRVADEQDAELLVVGRSRRGPLRRFFSREVAFGAQERAHCPVVVVGPRAPLDADVRSIVCAVDESPEGVRAAVVGAGLARRAHARLVLAHVVDVPRPVAPGAGPHGMLPVPVAQVEEIRSRDARLLLAAIQERVEGGIAIETRLTGGEPARTMERLAREEDADLIVVGRRGLGTLGEAVLGSVSAHLCANAEVPVVLAPATRAAA